MITRTYCGFLVAVVVVLVTNISVGFLYINSTTLSVENKKYKNSSVIPN